ncbi:hypothetical protein AAG570_006346 [Ranatra chinensis]|uniref:Phosphotransferase n=1 Tax=Ranatra chinensis TaxID=642074 RepID=A0ABD0Z4B3_9HEMI
MTELEKGIKDEDSSLQMENTYIPELPDGSEEGDFLALDLGGTNFRVLYLQLKCGKIVVEHVKKYHISDELRVGCGNKLFDYLAECVSNFIHSEGIADKKLPLGFSFSFPMHQRSLDVGILRQWTKSFAATSVEGKDAVQMLREAMQRRGHNNIDVVAILNDSTGTLMQGAAMDKRTRIGLILGTGSNACYVERADKVYHWESERHGEKEVVIDTEWGAYGDNGVIDFVKTDFDRQVDENSLFTNSFTFEKYIGGKYLGENVRVILAHLTKQKLIFGGNISKKLLIPNSFNSSFVSLIELDTVTNSIVETEKILDMFDLTYTNDDIAVVKLVCEMVSLRAAVLVSVCLSELLKHMNKDDVTIAVDGSLYKCHPRLKSWMEKFITLLAPDHTFHLLLAEDGSGKGAAFTAAIAARLRHRSMGSV